MYPSLGEAEDTEECQEGNALGNSNVFKFRVVSTKWDQLLPLTKTQGLQQAWNHKILSRFQRNHKSGKFPFPIVWLYNTQQRTILKPKCTSMCNKIATIHDFKLFYFGHYFKKNGAQYIFLMKFTRNVKLSYHVTQINT